MAALLGDLQSYPNSKKDGFLPAVSWVCYGRPTELWEGACLSVYLVSSQTPLQHCKRKGGLVNIIQHFCRSAEFRQCDLIGQTPTVY